MLNGYESTLSSRNILQFHTQFSKHPTGPDWNVKVELRLPLRGYSQVEVEMEAMQNGKDNPPLSYDVVKLFKAFG